MTAKEKAERVNELSKQIIRIKDELKTMLPEASEHRWVLYANCTAAHIHLTDAVCDLDGMYEDLCGMISEEDGETHDL